MTSMSAEEIRAQLTELQIIICDETGKYSEHDKDAANIQYERVFKALTQTSEYQAEIARIAEEKRKFNEPLNRAAWETMIHVYSKENIMYVILSKHFNINTNYLKIGTNQKSETNSSKIPNLVSFAWIPEQSVPSIREISRWYLFSFPSFMTTPNLLF